MKIGIVLSQTPVYSETFFNHKIKGLQDAGFEVQLFVSKASPQFSLCKVQLLPKVYKRQPITFAWHILKTYMGLLTHIKRVKKYIALEKARGTTAAVIAKRLYLNAPLLGARLDWLHFGFATMALQHELVAKAIGAKMAVSCRGYDMDVYPLKHPDAYKTLWAQVDKVHAISQHMLGQAKNTGMLETTPYSIITPAIDITAYQQRITNTEPGSVISILSVGRLHYIKGFMDTLEALAIFKQNYPAHRFQYSIIGSGELYEPLMFAIHQLGLSKEVKLMGVQPHEAVLNAMRTSDIYIQYSHSEGFCNAVLEAQASGCLCIVSDGGALPENVVDGITGFVVPKREPHSLAQALLKAIELSDQEREYIITNAGTRIEQAFSLKAQQEKFTAFYQS
ncbi:glycosyltransferase family 4 protein [Paucihalobacter ruber]|uniref:Glycosyltransferase family 4 protein n=1 Tax=Paucihalobacter ruber TaxID=2567861 RepID=A0A506PKY3_9FLAO|nr:glycosyltransferase family 4 protein [Paucihalobacter ruber]TPV33842.1 glycosyltransferase family 4 protein [Paucihalobacter ruber]